MVLLLLYKLMKKSDYYDHIFLLNVHRSKIKYSALILLNEVLIFLALYQRSPS